MRVLWVKRFLDDESRCNIIKDGVQCNKKITKKSSCVKSHVRGIHPNVYHTTIDDVATATLEEFGGKDLVLNEVAEFFATTTAPLSYLTTPSFIVSLVV